MGKKPRKFYKKSPHISQKKVKEKLPAEKKELPKNTRSIPEEKYKNGENPQLKGKRKMGFNVGLILLGILSIITIGAIFVIEKRVESAYTHLNKIEVERKTIEDSIAQWEETAILHPGSRDVYLKLAVLSYQLQDFSKAKAFIKRALVLDPNYQSALQWENIIVQKAGN